MPQLTAGWKDVQPCVCVCLGGSRGAVLDPLYRCDGSVAASLCLSLRGSGTSQHAWCELPGLCPVYMQRCF